MTNPTVWKAATCALIALTLAPIRVEATITSVMVDAARDCDNARGYTYADITVHGTVDRAIVLASETDELVFDPTVLGFGKSAFFTRNPTDPNWRRYRDGRDLTSARTHPAARPPQSEQR